MAEKTTPQTAADTGAIYRAVSQPAPRRRRDSLGYGLA